MKKAIVLAGSRGIGKAIADALLSSGLDVVATSTRELDTSDLRQVKKFIKEQRQTDILVMNTGGPPAKDFFDIKEDEWQHYHNQMFLGFCLILQNLKINEGGYIFLISSFNIKEPDPKLILSNAYRVAFSSVLKTLSTEFANRNVSCINIAPGPIKTDRLYSLVDDMDTFEATLPMGRAGRPEEIGTFVQSIVQNKIKYLTGVTINFDGGISRSLF
jgi:3-oxoacyl-[acyl-carrier protein] reductase